MFRLIKKMYEVLTRKQKAVSGGMIIGDASLVSIAENVHLSGNVILYANAPIEIGTGTMIAINTIIHTSTHDYHDHPMWKFRIDKPVKIGKHVWIGISALILPGVIISDYAVVGAGAIVTANVPEGAIVAGNPARIISYREKSWYDKKPDITHVNESRAKQGSHCENNCKPLQP